MNTASPDDSMMFVRRRTKPMIVRNRKAVIATPRSVDDSGDVAAAGYDYNSNSRVSSHPRSQKQNRRTSTIHHAEATYATAVAMSSANWRASPRATSWRPCCPSFCTTRRLERPSIAMNSGPESVSSVPHHAAAPVSHGLGVSANMLKHTRSRNGCMGTCSTESACEPQTRLMVPCTSAWRVSNSESRRKASFEIVASVSGRKMRICSAVDSLWGR